MKFVWPVLAFSGMGEMSKFDKELEKSIRVVLPLDLYEEVKERCIDYGDISRVIRHLLRKWIRDGGTVRQSFELGTKESLVYKAAEDVSANAKALRDQHLDMTQKVELLRSRVKQLETLVQSSRQGFDLSKVDPEFIEVAQQQPGDGKVEER